MDAGKPQAGGAGRVAVGIPFGQVASEARNPVVGATRQRQAAEPVLRDVWSKPADNPLVPAALALGETVRRRRAPAVAWATAFATVAAFTAVLLGWLTLPEDAFVPEETGGPVGWQSIRRGEAGGYSPALAAAADSGREARNAGLALPPVPIEPWGTADPTDRTPALAYALGVPRSRKPAPPNEPLAIAGEPTGALAAEAPAIRLVAGAQGAPKLDPSALIARGDEFLRQSDVVSARLFYRLAAANGSAAGAIAMGSTYDPVFLTRNAVRGVNPEPEKALVWYRRAVELGDPQGKTRAAQLLDGLRLDAARGDPRARAILEKATIE